MKTIICDIDGTLLDYLHDKPSDERGEHVALPGAIEHMREWEVQGCRIIIITGRRESERVRTEAELVDGSLHGPALDERIRDMNDAIMRVNMKL